MVDDIFVAKLFSCCARYDMRRVGEGGSTQSDIPVANMRICCGSRMLCMVATDSPVSRPFPFPSHDMAMRLAADHQVRPLDRSRRHRSQH
jgi:hypothetical protein